MPNYKNSKIYKIVNDELNLTYYGSTVSSLSRRLGHHKTDALIKNLSSKILFSTVKPPEIFLVEKYSCNDKEELIKRERYYIENNECVNIAMPYRDKGEACKVYRKNNLELCRKRCRDGNKKNLKLKEKFNCECGGKYTYEHKSSHKKTKRHIKYYA
tara:strand:- start:1385 stop:1855 length:471 start_codon:yes stop_codon:yes gene_type:complete